MTKCNADNKLIHKKDETKKHKLANLPIGTILHCIFFVDGIDL